MTVLTKKQLLMLHSQLIAETGGVDGLRDEGMLESAMNAPFQSFAGEEVYLSLQEKATGPVALSWTTRRRNCLA